MPRLVLTLALVAALTACEKRVPEGVPEVVLPPAPPAARPVPVVEDPPSPPVSALGRAYFAFDSAAISAEARAVLAENARLLAAHPDARVELQGHCDERGTTEYNLALGQRRASAARAQLVAQGVSANRIAVVSYGEERPARVGSDEGAWGQNRRVELRLLSDVAGLEGSTR